jgi:hypothetical protein
LVEVVVALGVFAAGIIPVLAFFGALTHSARADREAEAAAGIADALVSRLRTLPFDTLAARLKTTVQPGDKPADGRDLFFASLGGDKIGPDEDPVWNGSDRDKFFEITLLRNEELSPAERDADAAWLAFNVRLRWPAFRPVSAGGAVRTGESERMQELIFSGSVRR